ncbi:unnamed protein product [Caenorhabditis angaria]|uniref:Uncharacterized protein n=1 Tax=Caenorhabditis angaria TaxID=860376 RepID=A0A9P1IJ93_9PELO|nr:unnamed protein product [Caenorhabditis angaria]
MVGKLDFVKNSARIAISTIFVHFFSKFLFSPQRLTECLHLFSAWPLLQVPGQAAKDLAKLQKMTRFWPPHQETFYEFSLAYTISLILLLNAISIETVYQSLFSTSQKLGNFTKFVFQPFYASIIVFIFLLPMQRLAEMHILVLILNFAHILTTSYAVYFVWNAWRKEDLGEEVKEKTE